MQELTVDEVLNDPLILLLMRADKIRTEELAALLQGAARRNAAKAVQHRLH